MTVIRSNAQDLVSYVPSAESINSKVLSPNYHTGKKDSINYSKINFFIGYDLGEAVFNEFQSLGSEIGLKFKNKHIFRLSYTNLNLTEQHLSSDFANAVDGKNVKGKQKGIELFYDFPIFIDGLYLSPSVGHYEHLYTHTILDESLQNSSFTLGGAVSFTETDIFKIKGLYYRFSIPMRFNLTPIEETKLGNTTINGNVFDNNIWFFVGFQF